ncbi:MAG: hypothetical protein GY754_41355 [bacterium]|nr:hypothetical protein [bacterium]
MRYNSKINIASLNNYNKRLFVILYLFFVFICLMVIVPGNILGKSNDSANKQRYIVSEFDNEIVELSGDWFYHRGDLEFNAEGIPQTDIAWTSFKYTGDPLERGNSRIVWFKTELPAGEWDSPSLYLRGIYQVFEAYQDGKCIYAFGTIYKNGRAEYVGSSFHIIPLSPGYAGKSIYFRVWSNYHSIGTYNSVLAGSRTGLVLSLLRNKISYFFQGMIFIFIGLFGLGVFLYDRDQKAFFAFGLVAVPIGIIVILRTRLLLLFFDTPILQINIQMITSFLIPVGVGILLESLFGRGYKSIIRRFWQLYLLLALGLFSVAVLNIAPLTLLLPFFQKAIIAGMPVFLAIIAVFAYKGNTEAKIFLAGISIFALLTIYDLLSDLGVLPWLGNLISWGFSALIISILIILTYRVNKVEKELKRKVSALDRANRQIILSEEKYKQLVEGSEDIIFSLDDKWNFITANRAISTHLNIRPDRVGAENFLDLVYEGSDRRSLSKHIVIEQLDSFQKNKEPVTFKAEFKSSIGAEPKEMQVKLEFLNNEERSEILGKASRELEDSLVKYFIAEEQTFRIGNYLTTAGDMSYRLTANLKKYMDSQEVNRVRIALREIIINSIEHGNLNITFKRKTQLLREGIDTYMEFIARRQNDPEYGNKKVYISYSVKQGEAAYRITDEGKGFAYKKQLKGEIDQVNQDQLFHGRGIVIANDVFDKMEYSKKGTAVLLIKYF